MGDFYTEQLVKRQKASSTTLIKAILIILTVLSVVLIFMIPFGIIGPVIMIALDVFLFRSMDVEYEYLFVNGSLDIDKIMAKSRRKNMFSMEMTDLEMMAPSGSPELRPYQGLKGIDYSSGMPGADTYELIVVNNGEKKKIIFEPNKTVCKDVQKSLQVPGYNCIQKDGYVKLSVICRNVIVTDGRMYSIKDLT